jgi:flagellin
MALNVISNYAAQVAHRYLSKADAAASSSLAKLSAGTRVISAKDDAASLAIGSRLNAEVQAQKQAQTNAVQASSMLQIADGAMAKVNDILVRMKTLAVQAGSGQLSDTERGMLNTEYSTLLQEVDRIANVTKFNGVTLVDGTTTTQTDRNALTGANNDIESADGFANITLGNSVGNANVTVAYDSTTNVLTLTNVSTGESQGIDIGDTAITGNNTQKVNFDTLDITVELNSAFDKDTDIAAAANTYVTGSTSGMTGAIDLDSVTLSGTNAVAAATDSSMSLTRGTATSTVTFGNYSGSASLATTGMVSITMASASDSTDTFTLSFNVTTAFVSATNATADTLTLGSLGNTVFGNAATSSTTDFTFKLGTGSTAGVDDVTISVNAISAEALGISGGDITTSANANTASAAVSAAIDTLNTARAVVGAAQNRLDFASDNLATTIENTEAARSSLLDLDVASEMTMFTSKQILVQSGVSMLAQANQMPQNLLKLFQ